MLFNDFCRLVCNVYAKINEINVVLEFLHYVIQFFLYIVGLWGLRKWYFKKKCTELAEDIKKGKDLDKPLGDYVEGHGSKEVDIEICLIYWKNYPHNFKNDGYNRCLYASYHQSGRLLGSWKDNIGIKLCDHVWYLGHSIYFNEESGISFRDKSNKNYIGFKEYRDCQLVYYLPYKNIIGWDFELSGEKPRFYVKYKYDSLKLYDNEFWIVPRNPKKSNYSPTRIDKRLLMSKYNWWRFKYYRIISEILKLPPFRMKLRA